MVVIVEEKKAFRGWFCSGPGSNIQPFSGRDSWGRQRAKAKAYKMQVPRQSERLKFSGFQSTRRLPSTCAFSPSRMESNRMLWSVAEIIGGYILPSDPRMKISTFGRSIAIPRPFLHTTPKSLPNNCRPLPSRTTSIEKAAVQVHLAVKVASAAAGRGPGLVEADL